MGTGRHHSRTIYAGIVDQVEARQAGGAVVAGHGAGPAVLIAGRALVIGVDVVALVAHGAGGGGIAVLAVGDALLADALVGHPSLHAGCAHGRTHALVAVGIAGRAHIAVQVVHSGAGSACGGGSAVGAGCGTGPTLVGVLVQEIAARAGRTGVLG